ncbi:MAG: helix-turn-helix domain-containing protein [Treponema sp.]|jgi:transcriptional regulator with XRE-family HTH domain|nr:helix-turn-helix domain-containing protein [Treponema sp.]
MDQQELKAFGVLLQEARKNKGISQEKLAELSDLHRTYISDLERGLRNPTLSTIVTLAHALEMTASELLKELKYEK